MEFLIGILKASLLVVDFITEIFQLSCSIQSLLCGNWSCSLELLCSCSADSRGPANGLFYPQRCPWLTVLGHFRTDPDVKQEESFACVHRAHRKHPRTEECGETTINRRLWRGGPDGDGDPQRKEPPQLDQTGVGQIEPTVRRTIADQRLQHRLHILRRRRSRSFQRHGVSPLVITRRSRRRLNLPGHPVRKWPKATQTEQHLRGSFRDKPNDHTQETWSFFLALEHAGSELDESSRLSICRSQLSYTHIHHHRSCRIRHKEAEQCFPRIWRFRSTPSFEHGQSSGCSH